MRVVSHTGHIALVLASGPYYRAGATLTACEGMRRLLRYGPCIPLRVVLLAGARRDTVARVSCFSLGSGLHRLESYYTMRVSLT